MSYLQHNGLTVQEESAVRTGEYLLLEDAMRIVAQALPCQATYEIIPNQVITDEQGVEHRLHSYVVFKVDRAYPIWNPGPANMIDVSFVGRDIFIPLDPDDTPKILSREGMAYILKSVIDWLRSDSIIH